MCGIKAPKDIFKPGIITIQYALQTLHFSPEIAELCIFFLLSQMFPF